MVSYFKTPEKVCPDRTAHTLEEAATAVSISEDTAKGSDQTKNTTLFEGNQIKTSVPPEAKNLKDPAQEPSPVKNTTKR